MHILGLPAVKAPAYRSYEAFSADVRSYAPMEPEERNEHIERDLVTLNEQYDNVISTRNQAHHQTKAGCFTALAGMGAIMASALADSLLPAPVGTALTLGGMACAGIGTYSVFRNSHVRDYKVPDAKFEIGLQIEHLNRLKTNSFTPVSE